VFNTPIDVNQRISRGGAISATTVVCGIARGRVHKQMNVTCSKRPNDFPQYTRKHQRGSYGYLDRYTNVNSCIHVCRLACMSTRMHSLVYISTYTHASMKKGTRIQTNMNAYFIHVRRKAFDINACIHTHNSTNARSCACTNACVCTLDIAKPIPLAPRAIWRSCTP
jgi:hypothetical protein